MRLDRLHLKYALDKLINYIKLHKTGTKITVCKTVKKVPAWLSAIGSRLESLRVGLKSI